MARSLLLPALTLSMLAIIGPGAAADLSSQPARVLTFIEAGTTAADRCKAILRKYQQTLQQGPTPPRVRVLQEVGRPERFAVLTTAEHGEDLSGVEQKAAPVLDSLGTVLVAPPDRHTNRDFVPAAHAATDSANDIYVIIHIDVGPPDRAKGEAALTRLAGDARASAGNTRFDLWQQLDRSNHFNIVAAWGSRAKYDEFVAGAGGREFRLTLAPMLASPYDARLFRPID